MKEEVPVVVATHNGKSTLHFMVARPYHLVKNLHLGNTSKTPTVQQSGHKINRVMSAFIRQMSEENLLVPEESIDLIGKVGQGKVS